MRAWQWGGGVCLGLVLVCSLAAQTSVFQGGAGARPVGNQPIDTSRLVTPLPPVPQNKKPFNLRDLLPSWLLPDSGPNSVRRPAPRSTPPTNNNASAFQPQLPITPQR